ncbi:MAG: hypothetical protein IJC16_03335 [Rikenellaceae bacterium]|nr:hypothetical protein [Rikenellaceae bacterium]
MAASNKNEPVFDLIKSMSKAEKRNFKLYATRLSGNQEAKFLALFDCLDSADDYDEAKVLARCPIKKEQLPNMKAHLYKQILVSIRLLNVQHSEPMQLREQLDFARILYDKGLYRQCTKTLEKSLEQALALEQYAAALDIIEFQKQIESLNTQSDSASRVEAISRQASEMSRRSETINDLSRISMQLYGLYLTLGYARTQKDLDLILQYFRPRLAPYAGAELSFLERFYYYEAMAWYSYIQHDFLLSYKYARRWVELFDSNPQMKRLMYDNYMKGYARLLEGLYLMRSYQRFTKALAQFEHECEEIGAINDNAMLISQLIIFTNRLNKHFFEGSFEEGIALIPRVEAYITRFAMQLNLHNKMLLYYKIACLYFGMGNYTKCIHFLGRITATRDPQIRRDLQCFSRMLTLIASYEAGIDYNLDYQIKSVFRFLVKMNDMNQVQREMLSFLKKLNSIYESDVKEQLAVLYERLKPYENHPYERRTFYYLDVLSWLESKMSGRSVAEIIRQKFESQEH